MGTGGLGPEGNQYSSMVGRGGLVASRVLLGEPFQRKRNSLGDPFFDPFLPPLFEQLVR